MRVWGVVRRRGGLGLAVVIVVQVCACEEGTEGFGRAIRCRARVVLLVPGVLVQRLLLR